MAIGDQFKKIDTLQKQILKLEKGPVKWDQDYLEKVKVDFTYASNNLEGNKISHGQTIQILKDLVSPKDTSISDYLDILNHKKVLDLVFENYQAERITESNIKKLHRELMKNPAQWSDDTYCDPGRYKLFENRTYRSDGKEHLYAEPKDVQAAMEVLIRETNEALDISSTDIKFHPLLIATHFHFVFLNQIHPFGDGNGRIARIFMNLILLQKGFPPIFIKEVNKRDYLECFTEEEKRPGAMLEFMAERLLESLKLKKKHLLASLSNG